MVFTYNKEYEAIAYTDGSFDKSNKVYTYGAVLFYNNKKYEMYEKFNDLKWASMHNVSGEIMGVLKVINFIKTNNIKSILIYIDYIGLQKWADYEWKTNKILTKKYQKYVNNLRNNCIIEFKWIKAHNKNKYNEMADKLANRAYSLKSFSKNLI